MHAGLVQRDPIFDAIEKFKAANRRWAKASNRSRRRSKSKEDFLAAEKECDAAFEALQEAANKLVYGMPTTMAGMVAWFDYIISFDNPELFWPVSSNGAECYEFIARFHEHVRDGLKAMPAAA